jgi:hypothetical protein
VRLGLLILYHTDLGGVNVQDEDYRLPGEILRLKARVGFATICPDILSLDGGRLLNLE